MSIFLNVDKKIRTFHYKKTTLYFFRQMLKKPRIIVIINHTLCEIKQGGRNKLILYFVLLCYVIVFISVDFIDVDVNI